MAGSYRDTFAPTISYRRRGSGKPSMLPGSCRKSGHPMPRPSSYAVRSLAAIRSSSHRRRPPRRQLVCGEANRRTSPIAATSPAATVTLRPLYTTHCWSCRWHLLSAGERHDAGYQRQLQQQLRDWLIAMASLSAPISAPATEASEPDPVCILFEGPTAPARAARSRP